MSDAIARPAALQDLDTVRVLWKRDVMRFFRQPSRIVGALGQPVIFWIMIGSGLAGTFRLADGGPGYMEYFFPGVVMMVVLFASIFSTLSVIEDRHRGFLAAVLCAPGSKGAMVLGKALGSTTVATVQAGIFLALAPFAGFDLADISWGPLVAALVLSSLALTAFGFTVAWWLDNVQAFHAVQMTLLVPLWIISGAMFPAPEGGAFAAIMRVNPVAYWVEAVRRSMYGGRLPEGVPELTSMAGDFAVVVGSAALAFALAVVAVHTSRVKGKTS